MLARSRSTPRPFATAAAVLLARSGSGRRSPEGLSSGARYTAHFRWGNRAIRQKSASRSAVCPLMAQLGGASADLIYAFSLVAPNVECQLRKG